MEVAAKNAKVSYLWWHSKANQKTCFDKIAKELSTKSLILIWLDINNFTDWYRIKHADIIRRGGGTVLKKYLSLKLSFFHWSWYGNSLITTLRVLYPDVSWDPRGFGQRGYWNEQFNHRQFLDLIAKELNIKKPQEWYSVSIETVLKKGGGTLLSKYNNSLSSALKVVSFHCY